MHQSKVFVDPKQFSAATWTTMQAGPPYNPAMQAVLDTGQQAWCKASVHPETSHAKQVANKPCKGFCCNVSCT